MSALEAMQADRGLIEKRILDYLSTQGVSDAGHGSAGDVPIAETGGLDSLGIVQLSMFVGEEFGIAFEDDDFVEQNFQTVGTLAQLVEARLAK